METRPILHLQVKIDKIEYILGTLRFNKGEFSYFFTYPANSPSEHLYCNTEEYTSRLDHITWHKKQIHIKRLDGVLLDPIHLPKPLLTNPPELTLLYVESLRFDSTPSLFEKSEFNLWKGAQIQEILNIESAKGFSMIFLLTPSCEPTESVLLGLKFADIPEGFSSQPCLVDLCAENYRVGRIQVWKDWDVIVVPSPFIRRIASPIDRRIGLDFRIPDYKNPQAALTDLMLQTKAEL